MMGARYGQTKKLTYKTAAILRDALALREDTPRRSDGRLHDTGLIRPYRPRPADFREVYVQMGWDGIDEHYGTNWRVIRRWVEEEGRAGLVAARAAYVEEQRALRRSRKAGAARKYGLSTIGAPRRSDVRPGQVAEVFAMVAVGLTQTEVARRLGIDLSTVGRIISEESARLGLTAVKPVPVEG